MADVNNRVGSNLAVDERKSTVRASLWVVELRCLGYIHLLVVEDRK